MKRALSFILSLMLVFVMTAQAVAPQGTTAYTTVLSTEPQEPYTVGPSTPTPRALRQMRLNRPRNAPIRQLKAAERKFKRVIKKTTPNPKVQAPSAYPMPA